MFISFFLIVLRLFRQFCLALFLFLACLMNETENKIHFFKNFQATVIDILAMYMLTASIMKLIALPAVVMLLGFMLESVTSLQCYHCLSNSRHPTSCDNPTLESARGPGSKMAGVNSCTGMTCYFVLSSVPG